MYMSLVCDGLAYSWSSSSKSYNSGATYVVLRVHATDVDVSIVAVNDTSQNYRDELGQHHLSKYSPRALAQSQKSRYELLSDYHAQCRERERELITQSISNVD
jgi:hypothetical protein